MKPTFPKISDSARIQCLVPSPRPIRMVLDTDTYNEVDDQFALVYSLLSPEKMSLEAVYAAPFHNNRSSGAEDGMEQSYDEILRLLDYLKLSSDNFVYKGARQFLTKELKGVASPATDDLIARAMASSTDDPLYVVAIAALTNVATAILLEPRIIEKIVVVWLGGHALNWHDTREFNLAQDIPSAQIVFDCGVPLIQVPCMGVTSHLYTTVSELERYVSGHSSVGDYLVNIVKEYRSNAVGWSKVIWDIAPIAYLVNPDWVPTVLTHSPILTDQITWSRDETRHFIRYAIFVHRDAIFKDLFEKLASTGNKAQAP